MNEVEDYITYRLFNYLETHPDEILFDWFKMNGSSGIYLNRFIVAQTHNTEINIDHNNNNEIDNVASTIINFFIEHFNRRFEYEDMDTLGIYYIMLSPTIYNPETFEPCNRVIFKVAPMHNENIRIKLSERTKIKKPKRFKF